MGRVLSHWDRQETTVLRRKRLKKVPMSAPRLTPACNTHPDSSGQTGQFRIRIREKIVWRLCKYCIGVLVVLPASIGNILEVLEATKICNEVK